MSSEAVSTESRYLIYKIGAETYGTPLLDVREVVEYQKPKFMPNMEAYFVGVINVRGAIVGVVDMRLRFSQNASQTKMPALLICESDRGSIAAVVDQVEAVVSIPATDIEKNPPIVARVEPEYLLGVAKIQERLITLIDLKSSLTEMKVVQKAA